MAARSPRDLIDYVYEDSENEDGSLFLRRLGRQHLAQGRCQSGLPGQVGEGFADRAVGNILNTAVTLCLQAAEIVLPGIADCFGIAQIALVEVFDESSVAAVEG